MLPRSHKGRWRRVLELLAAAGGTMRRAVLKERLDALSESHLSHLLRDLEEAEMIVRRRPERSREVLVELRSAGREIVAARVSSDDHGLVEDRGGKDRGGKDRSGEDRGGEDRGADRDARSSSTWAPWLD